MSVRTGDIRDQSRKLPKIAQKFGPFFPSQILEGRPSKKLYPFYHPCLAARRLEKFREDTPISSVVIGAHMLNLRPNFEFSRLKFFGGPPSPVLCALGSLGQNLTRVEI